MIFAKEPYLLHLLAGSDTMTALDAAKSLLDSGAHNANEREPTDDLAPLHVAAAWDNLAMCQLLIHYGAESLLYLKFYSNQRKYFDLIRIEEF